MFVLLTLFVMGIIGLAVIGIAATAIMSGGSQAASQMDPYAGLGFSTFAKITELTGISTYNLYWMLIVILAVLLTFVVTVQYKTKKKPAKKKTR